MPWGYHPCNATFMPSQPRRQFNRRNSTGEKIELAKAINGQACRINSLLFQNKMLWTIKVGDKTFDVLDISQLSQANQQVKVIIAVIQRRPRQGTPGKWRGHRLWSTKDGRKIEQISKENNSPAEWNWRRFWSWEKQSIYDWNLRRNQSIPAPNEAADCPSFLSSPCNFAMASVHNSMFFTPNMQTNWPCAAGS